MADFRIEKDSLGELKVPAGVLYGAQTQRAVDNFPISGLRPWRAFIWSMATVKRAAAEVNAELGLFNGREVDGKHFSGEQLSQAISQAAQEVIEGKCDAERVQRSAAGLRRLGIGGTAVGSGLNARPGYHARMVKKLSALTGLTLYTSDNLFESMQSMADAADFSASMRTLALTLIRIANDFRLLASGPSTGLDEIRLPAVQPGSSIMPGKVNPVLAEMLDQPMFHVIACDTTVAMAVQAGQLELNVMMPVIAHNLFEMMQVMIGSVNAFSERAVKGLAANREKAEGWLAKNAIVVTALNPIIGYSQGAALVKEALAKDASILELAVEKARSGTLKHRDEDRLVTEAEITNALSDLRALTEGGISGVAGGG